MTFSRLIILVVLQAIGSSLLAQSYYSTATRDDRIKLLTIIYKNDKAVRQYQDSVRYASGFHSTEDLMAIDSVFKMDTMLTARIVSYLGTFGYPELETYGEIPTLTPWMILHHSKNEKVKRSNYKILYKAYEDENLEQRRIIEYLEDLYELKFQKQFHSYLRDQARIKELEGLLEL